MKISIKVTLLIFIILITFSTIVAQEKQTADEQIKILSNQAAEYYNAGDYEKAIKYYTKVIQLDSTHAGTYYYRAIIYGEQEKYDLAIADLGQVNQLAPDFPDAYGNLGWYLILQGKFDEARKSTEKAHELAPESMLWIMNLGHIYLLTGDTITARKYYQKTLTLLKSEEEFNTGPAADFKLFIIKGWQVNACQKQLQWMQHQFETNYRYYIQADDYFIRAKALIDQQKFLEAAQMFENSIKSEELSSKIRLEILSLELSWAGYSYYKAGKYDKTEPLFKRALGIRVKMLGTEHPTVANSLNNLAELYRTQGRYAGAESLFKRALGIREKVLGTEHPDVAVSLNNLAVLYDNQGRYAEAEPLYKRALGIREKTQGTEHPDVANSLNNLAEFYRTQGHYTEAEPLYKRALGIREKTLGAEHPHVAASLDNLAVLYKSQGRYAEAESLYKRALGIREKTLGAEHPHVATSLNNLAGLYDDQGCYAEAESLYKRALGIKEKALGTEHPDVAVSLNNLAEHYRTKGRYAEAEPLYKRALGIIENMLGVEHPDVAISLNNLGAFYDSQGYYAGAEPLYQQAHHNMFDQIKRYFIIMSEKEKGEFYNTIRFNFEAFNSFVIKRNAQNPHITGNMYNNQLITKALLLNSTNKVKKLILSSGNDSLIASYQRWREQKEYLAKVYMLSKAEIARQGINKDSLETVTNDLEKQLSRKSEAFAQATDTTLFTWQDIYNQLNPHEAAIEIVRFEWFHKEWTDTIYYAALIVTPDTKDHPELVLLKNGNDLEGKYFEDYIACRQNTNFVAYQQYWRPIKEKLKGINKVYFSPDGIYNQMNLNILYNQETGKYVLDEIDIHLVTNTKDILQFNKQEKGKKTAKLFGKPAYNLKAEQHLTLALAYKNRSIPDSWVSDLESDKRKRSGYSDLPGTEAEVKSIDSLLTEKNWESKTYLGKDALEEAVKAVDNPGILHIATHGFFIESDENKYDKRFRNVVPIIFAESHLILLLQLVLILCCDQV